MQKALPGLPVIYFGDTANLPFGTKSKKIVTKYTIAGIKFLINKGAEVIIIACSTASSLAYNEVKKKFKNTKIFEVITPTVKEAVKKTKNKKIGVIATPSTVKSKVYSKKIVSTDKKIKAYELACPLLVPLIEEGWVNSIITKKILKIYLSSLKKNKIDTLILGCTHYPLILKTIRGIMGKEVSIVDSAKNLAEEVKNYILNCSKTRRLNRATGKIIPRKPVDIRVIPSANVKFYVSDEPYKFAKLTKLCLGKTIKVKKIK